MVMSAAICSFISASEGELLPLPEERAEQKRQHAENAERAHQEAIPRLLGMGLTPEQVAEVLGLSVETVRSSP
jgi:DNA-binding NarL/FixJ family response regulator